MAIDLQTETVFTFAEAAKRLPKRRQGRPVHVATIHRWAKAGVRGVRLESLRLGGGLVTSAEALQRFCDRLTAGGSADPTVRTSRLTERAAIRAENELKAHGI